MFYRGCLCAFGGKEGVFSRKKKSIVVYYTWLNAINFTEIDSLGTIHLRRQHVLGAEGSPHVPMVKRSQYIRIKNPLHKHFVGMPMVGGLGSKIVKIC